MQLWEEEFLLNRQTLSTVPLERGYMLFFLAPLVPCPCPVRQILGQKEEVQHVTDYKLVMKVMKNTPVLRKAQNSQDGVSMPIGQINAAITVMASHDPINQAGQVQLYSLFSSQMMSSLNIRLAKRISCASIYL